MDIKTIQHIAGLAKIKLTDKEEEKMKNDLSSVLNYIDKLNLVNTDNVEPLYQVTGLVNSMRLDEVISKIDNAGSRLIDQAPENQDNFVKVKSVLSK